ncbi:MAG TPA: PKD domain-containing protein [Candidatus Thermoplasmatota archaeon]
MPRARPAAALLVVLLIAPALLAPIASAGSHSRLVVVLWNESAQGAAASDTFVVWAEVFDGGVPVNASSVTFYWGFHFPPIFFATPYAGSYAGSTGRYNASVVVTAGDVTQGINILSVEVAAGNDRATSSRIVILLDPGFGGPGGGGPWTVHAGVENLPELGTRVDPGETLVWRVETRNNGTLQNAPSLTADLYSAPVVTFAETPSAMTVQNVGAGVYEVRYTVPPALAESRQLVLQAHISETNEAWSNGTADVWFHDTVVDFAAAHNAWIAGTLTVGDGRSVVAGLNVSLHITEAANASHSIGWINGTTNATGRAAFNVTNDGTNALHVDGWVNGTLAQRVSRDFLVRDLFVQPVPDAGRFDAIPLADTAAVPWEGTPSLPFEFWRNGTRHANAWVHAYVHSARGAWSFANLTTDGQGRANLTVDFQSAPPFAFDDIDIAAAGGGDIRALVNATFRAPVGPDGTSSDGRWWGEDEETIGVDPFASLITQLVDTNLSFASETFVKGSTFGVASKYTGPKNASGWEAAGVLVPGSFSSALVGLVDRYAIWTGSDFPFVSYLRRGAGAEFFGCAYVPAYWPGTDYSLVSVQVPTLADLSSDDGLPAAGALGWTALALGSSASGFVPSPDTQPPEVYGVADLAVDLGQTLDVSAQAYDDSLDFCGAGNYTWEFDDPNVGPVIAYGAAAAVALPSPGVIAATLTVADATGNSVVVPFNVTVTDVTAPSADAGPDLDVVAGTTVNFTGSASDDDPAFPAGANFSWDFMYNGSPVSLAGRNTSFTFDLPGVYNVTLRAADAGGNVGTDPMTVTVRVPDLTPPAVDAGPDVTVFAGEVVDFTPTVSDDDPLFPSGAAFEWSFMYNGSPVALTTMGASFTFDIEGTYTVTLTVRDAAGNSASDQLVVTVLPPDTAAPAVGAGPDQVVVAGTTVAFQGTATDDDPAFPAGATMEWSFSYNGSVVVLQGLTGSFTFDLPGSYLVAFEVRDRSGNLGADALMVDVLPPDTEAPVVDAGPDVTIVSGATLGFQGSATDNDPAFPVGSTVTWTFVYRGMQQTYTGYSFAFLFDTPGSYDVTLSVEDAWANAGTDELTVTVLPPDTAPPAIQPIADMEATTGVAVTFEATATDNSADFSAEGRYNWTFTHAGTAYDLTGSTVTFTFTVAELVDVTLTVADASGNSATETFQVRVRAPDTTPPSILLAQAKVTARVGEDVLLSASASDGGNPITAASAFVWSFTVGGTPVTLTGGQATYRFDAAGTYNITLRVTDAAGNVGTAHMEVVVEEGGTGPTSPAGMDPMLLAGVLIALVALAGLAWAATRKRGSPEDEFRPPGAAREGQASPRDSAAHDGSEEE